MKIYLAGPMSGIPFFNFPQFSRVAGLLRNAGHDVFNPAEYDIERYGPSIANATGDQKQATTEHGFSLRETLAADCNYICLEADAICMLPGWENSPGARAEHALACALKHRIIYCSRRTAEESSDDANRTDIQRPNLS